MWTAVFLDGAVGEGVADVVVVTAVVAVGVDVVSEVDTADAAAAVAVEAVATALLREWPVQIFLHYQRH